MSTALGVAQDDGTGLGTTDTAFRQITGAEWTNKGIVAGLAVTGTSSLAYHVAAGVAICSKGDSDGKTKAYWEGGNTAAVAGNTSGNARIDSVYIYANDLTQGDADNLVHIGVAQGTAAATPSAPDIPPYATRLADLRLPGGSTSTAGATLTLAGPQAIPFMLATVQSDGTHIWTGTDIFSESRGPVNGQHFVYLWNGRTADEAFPGFHGVPYLFAQNGDWNVQCFTVTGTANQENVGIVFGVPESGAFRINWILIGQYDPSLVR